MIKNKKKISTDSITRKVVITLFASIITVMLVIGVIYFFTARSDIRSDITKTAKQTADRLSNSLIYPMWNLNFSEVEKTLLLEIAERNIMAIVVNDQEDKFFIGKIRDWRGTIIEYNQDAINKNEEGIKSFLKNNFFILTRKIEKDGEYIGSVKIFITDLYYFNALKSLVIKIILQTVVLSIIIIASIFFSMKKIILSPLISMEEEVAKFHTGNFDVQVPVLSNDEIGKLGKAFNRTILELKESFGEIEFQLSENRKADAIKQNLFNDLQKSNEALKIEVNYRKKAEEALNRAHDALEEKVKERTAELSKTNDELKKALTDIKTLSGMLPICASCKKIRNDSGYWEQVEEYLIQHSDKDFALTHSICPDCVKKLFPDDYKELLGET